MRLAELALAAALLGAGIWLYRRRPAGEAGDAGHYGSQGAVLLFVVAAILGIHALGGLDYRPSDAELDAIKARAQ